MKNFGLWLKGLVAAVLGGAIASVAQVAATGSAQPANLKTAAVTGAALTLSAYLTQSPVGSK
jgi:hypothetical protein